jgi:copper chaperone CopZ
MTTRVSIPGIHCEGCARLIKDVSGDYPAIAKLDVDLQAKTVTIQHEPAFDLAAWTKEIEALNEAFKVNIL